MDGWGKSVLQQKTRVLKFEKPIALTITIFSPLQSYFVGALYLMAYSGIVVRRPSNLQHSC